MADKNPTQKKRKHKSRAPPGPDQAQINWKEDEFQNLVRGHNFRSEWGARYPPSGSTALDAPPGFITLYAAYFREGNFRLPITKFVADVLRGYGLHISQINAIGLPRITHFEFVCRSYRVEPTFPMFNTFYSVSYSSGFYSFQARMGVAQVCSVPIKGIHDWKQKFFYIRRGVIPTDMSYRHVDQGVPRVDVLPNYGDQDWFKKITAKPTAISQLDEMALVGAGMSLLWVPKHPLGQPAYSHKGKFGYSLLNALDPKSAGAMVEAIQADGNPTWLEQIHDRFLHPTDASLSGYANEVLGTTPGGVAEPVHGFADDDDDAEASVDPSAQLETRKRARTEKSVRKEGKKEGGAAGSSRPGEVRQGSDPDDKATLTEHMKKKALDDHKRHLDEQAAALLAAKKAKLQKDAPPAPSESEVDLGVFSGGRGNLLEKIFEASASRPGNLVSAYVSVIFHFVFFANCNFVAESKTSKKPRPVDISQITPPTSPPSRTVGLTPPRDDADVTVKGGEGFEGIFEGGDAAGGDVGGDAGGVDKGKGIEVEMESSETTPQQTIYTKRPPVEGGATSGFVRSPHFEQNPGDSWGNPACDDLPHVPRWGLTQGSRMNDLQNCQEFFSLSLPPAERMFQKNRSRFALIDDHVTAGVNFFATSQEILREWRSMGEETMAFEEAKKAFAGEKEKFNTEQKGLQWRVTEAERKFEEQKQLNEQKQKDWESACARTNVEMQSQRDAIVRLSGEKTALAEEAHQARLAAEKKEKDEDFGM
ncbi:uncharacterized protein LOC110933087 [Helianthus annuus]|uniref:uncharacterized protein LOC110933087 n=1 Tax=Helianthus annuus TaxID=4232 RepID=UPI0016531C0F|nr:uncharacterized protein LOC110933087 [Helianthus annuus]